jgi:two-component system chemotaxis response regulator CheY
MDLEMSILVVDDFQFARRICVNVLKEIGLNNITEVSSGSTALDALSKKTFGLIITDQNMPGMSGIELIQKVRADEKLKHIPIIMVTSEGSKGVLLEATEAGVNAFLNKPFTKEDLIEKIERLSS